MAPDWSTHPLVCSHLLGVVCTKYPSRHITVSCHFRNIQTPHSCKDMGAIIELCFASRYTKAYSSPYVLLILSSLFSYFHYYSVLLSKHGWVKQDTKTRGQAPAFLSAFLYCFFFQQLHLLLHCITGLGLKFLRQRKEWFFGFLLNITCLGFRHGRVTKGLERKG